MRYVLPIDRCVYPLAASCLTSLTCVGDNVLPLLMFRSGCATGGSCCLGRSATSDQIWPRQTRETNVGLTLNIAAIEHRMKPRLSSPRIWRTIDGLSFR